MVAEVAVGLISDVSSSGDVVCVLQALGSQHTANCKHQAPSVAAWCHAVACVIEQAYFLNKNGSYSS
jgi:hypothetical protein